MKYPLKTHKTGGYFPAHGNCGTCGNPTNGSFVCLSISASERIGDTDSSGPANVKISVHLLNHRVTEPGSGLTLFDGINDSYFCSAVCMRAFFNQVVTDFENGVE